MTTFNENGPFLGVDWRRSMSSWIFSRVSVQDVLHALKEKDSKTWAPRVRMSSFLELHRSCRVAKFKKLVASLKWLADWMRWRMYWIWELSRSRRCGGCASSVKRASCSRTSALQSWAAYAC